MLQKHLALGGSGIYIPRWLTAGFDSGRSAFGLHVCTETLVACIVALGILGLLIAEVAYLVVLLNR